MKIIIEIDDELLYITLFHGHPMPKSQTAKEEHWIIEAQTRRLLRHYGFSCYQDEDHDGTCWWATSCPVKFNDSYALPDGYVIESHGTSLTHRRKQGLL